MSFTRRLLVEQAERLSIPKKTIAFLAETGPSNVSLFFNQNVMAQRTEDRIAKIIREIAAFCQRYGDLKINLENAEFVKILLGKVGQQSYSVLANFSPTEYIVVKNGSVETTAFFLQASGFDLVTAVRVSAENADRFPEARLIDNPYCGINDRAVIADVSEDSCNGLAEKTLEDK